MVLQKFIAHFCMFSATFQGFYRLFIFLLRTVYIQLHSFTIIDGADRLSNYGKKFINFLWTEPLLQALILLYQHLI